MSLHSPTHNQNRVRPSGSNSLTTLSFPQAYSGNPGEIRTGPPIRTVGGDELVEVHLFTLAASCGGEHEELRIDGRLIRGSMQGEFLREDTNSFGNCHAFSFVRFVSFVVLFCAYFN